MFLITSWYFSDMQPSASHAASQRGQGLLWPPDSSSSFGLSSPTSQGPSQSTEPPTTSAWGRWGGEQQLVRPRMEGAEGQGAGFSGAPRPCSQPRSPSPAGGGHLTQPTGRVGSGHVEGLLPAALPELSPTPAGSPTTKHPLPRSKPALQPFGDPHFSASAQVPPSDCVARRQCAIGSGQRWGPSQPPPQHP